MSQPPSVAAKKRSRSPNYPGITLKDAIERVQVIFKQEGRNLAHEDTVLGHWGYKRKSGAGLVVLAALKSFGLIGQEGSGGTRRVRISEPALKLVMLSDEEHAEERQAVLKEAALKPRIHHELWGKYVGALPSDKSLEYELVSNWGFTQQAAKDFVPRFRATIAYAGLTEADRLTDDAGDNDEPDEFETSDPFKVRIVTTPMASPKVVKAPPGSAPRFEQPPADTVATTVIPILLPALGQVGALKLPTEMSETEWKMMLAIIEAYKSSIVQPLKRQATKTDKGTTET